MRFQIYRDPFSGCWEQTCYNLTQGFYAYHLAGYVTGSILVQTLDSSSIWFENWNTNSDWYIGFTNPILFFASGIPHYCKIFSPAPVGKIKVT